MRRLRPLLATAGAMLTCAIVTSGQARLATRVKDINASSGDAFPRPNFDEPSQFVTVNGIVYFRAVDGMQGSVITGTPGELWRTDGTPASTVRVKDIDPTAWWDSL